MLAQSHHVCVPAGNPFEPDSPSSRDLDGVGPIVQEDVTTFAPWFDEDLPPKARAKV